MMTRMVQSMSRSSDDYGDDLPYPRQAGFNLDPPQPSRSVAAGAIRESDLRGRTRRSNEQGAQMSDASKTDSPKDVSKEEFIKRMPEGEGAGPGSARDRGVGVAARRRRTRGSGDEGPGREEEREGLRTPLRAHTASVGSFPGRLRPDLGAGTVALGAAGGTMAAVERTAHGSPGARPILTLGPAAGRRRDRPDGRDVARRAAAGLPWARHHRGDHRAGDRGAGDPALAPGQPDRLDHGARAAADRDPLLLRGLLAARGRVDGHPAAGARLARSA